MRLYVFALCAFIRISQLPSVHLTQVSQRPFDYHKNSKKFLGIYPVPPKTPASIHIDTSKAKEMNLDIFKFFGGIDERVEVINTGKSVEVYLDQNETVSSISGGPFFDNVYKFHKLVFYWISNGNASVHTTLDGHRVELVAIVYFYKEEYGSFNEAIKHRDGIGEVNLPVGIDNTPNLLFVTFEEVLKEIRKPGSKKGTYLGNTFQWYDGVTPFSKYFAYQGAYKDVETGHIYYCTTTIVYSLNATFSISKEQFHNTFGSLEDKDGKPLNNIDQPQPSTAVVIQSSRTLQILIPTGKSLEKVLPVVKD